MSEPGNEVQDLTRISMEECSFTWSIESFSTICSIKTKRKEALNSSTFTTSKSPSTKWCLQLKFDDNVNLEIFLERLSSDTSAHYVIYGVSIIGSDKIKYHSQLYTKGDMYDDESTSFGYDLIERKKLLKEERSLLLPGDKLTVVAELKIYNVDSITSDLLEETEVISSSACNSTESKVPQKSDSVIVDLQNLYENKMMADFTLKVGDEELKVHKLILCARSSVLNTMLNCDMKENLTNCVEITDFDPPVVKNMLQYIYYGQIEDLTSELSIQLYSIADKYNLQDLKEICVKYLLKNLDVDNICDVLVIGELHNELELMKTAKTYFGQNAAVIQKTEKWLNLSKTMPELVIAMYQLAISQKEK